MTRRKQAPRKASAPLRDAGTEEKQPLRKSKRLEKARLSRETERNRGDQKTPNTHQPAQTTGRQHNSTRKRTQSVRPSQGNPPTKRRKTAPKQPDTSRPKPVKAKKPARQSRGNRSRNPTSGPQAVDGTPLSAKHIEHWTHHNQWPHSIFEPQKSNDMAGSKKSRVTALRQETSEETGPTSTSAARGIYKLKHFPELLKTGDDGIKCFMHDDEEESSGADAQYGPTDASQALCRKLESKKHQPQSNSRFLEDAFLRFRLRKLIDENETEIIDCLSELACPSAWDNTLEYDYSKFVERKNEAWIHDQPSMIRALPPPKPDYCVGYSRKAFSEDQLARLDKSVKEKPRIRPLRDMYFPFLTCEAKSYLEKIVIADRQNAHSMMVSIHALIDLFRGAQREQSLHREILGFSVSYDHELVHVHGHYPVIRGGGGSDRTVDIFQTEVCAMRISPKDLGSRWKSWNFVRNIYEIWAPKHLERLCAAIDNLTPDWGVPPPPAPLPPPEPTPAEKEAMAQAETGPTPMSQSADLLQGLQMEDQVEGEESDKSDATVKQKDGRKTRKQKNKAPPAAAAEGRRSTRADTGRQHTTKKRKLKS